MSDKRDRIYTALESLFGLYYESSPRKRIERYAQELTRASAEDVEQVCRTLGRQRERMPSLSALLAELPSTRKCVEVRCVENGNGTGPGSLTYYPVRQ